MKIIRIVRRAPSSNATGTPVWWVVEHTRRGFLQNRAAQYVASGRTLREVIAKYKACCPTPPPIRAATIGTWTNHSTPEPAPRGRGIIAAHVIACPARFTQTELRAQLKGKVYYGHTVVDVECLAVERVNKGDRIGLVVDMREKP